jgi:guanylate kinase
MSLNVDAWNKPDRGALFIVTGASGTGKTTLVKRALSTISNIQFSVSATTRAKREGETDGKDYHFLERSEFERLKEDEALLEWAQVYKNFYGTLREPVLKALRSGESILLEIDQQGAAQVKAQMPEAISIFILPPTMDSLERRLRNRNTDSDEIIARRLREAQDQIDHCGSFDYLVINDDLESASDQFMSILIAELLKRNRRDSWVQKFVPNKH